MHRIICILAFVTLTASSCKAQKLPSGDGYLECFEMPATDITENTRKGFVQETYGGSYAYTYDIADSSRLVIHTFIDNKVHRNYSLIYDYRRHCPLWVAYHMNKGYCSCEGERTNAWSCDPAVSSHMQPDLSRSYCKGGDPYNRGHMLSSHARTGIRVANQQTFYFTNMVPQLSATFNCGGSCWDALEDAEIAAAPYGRDTLYVVTGCIFEDSHKTVKNRNDGIDCAVPDSFFKCYMKCSFDSSGTVTSAKAIGYIIPHNAPKNTYYSRYAASIDKIESITGWDFFANVPKAIQEKAEATMTKIL